MEGPARFNTEIMEVAGGRKEGGLGEKADAKQMLGVSCEDEAR
jgi:hypothetical protein